jgi:hypothetical protein
LVEAFARLWLCSQRSPGKVTDAVVYYSEEPALNMLRKAKFLIEESSKKENEQWRSTLKLMRY